MPRRSHTTFTFAATLIALAMQWCIPLAHAMHEAGHVAAPRADHQHHHHHDHGEDAGSPTAPHDESQCPTCQQFGLLRVFTSLDAPVTPVAVDLFNVRAADVYDAPYVSRVHHSPAVPRGPPVR